MTTVEKATYTMAEVGEHSSPKDCWVVWDGRVFDVTAFASKHPGGAQFILDFAGRDVTTTMRSPALHDHSKLAYQMLPRYEIGTVDHGQVDRNGSTDGKRVANGTGMTHRARNNGVNDSKQDTGENKIIVHPADRLINFDEGLVFQVWKLGKEYESWVYTPMSDPVKMFSWSWMDNYSRTPWYMPLIWTLPIAWLLFQQVMLPLDDFGGVVANKLIVSLLAYAGGVFTFTLLEYIIHKQVFHFSPPHDSKLLITWHFYTHGIHHKTPLDNTRMVVPPVGGALMGMPMFIAAYLLLPSALHFAYVAGLITWFVVYDLGHALLHMKMYQWSYFKFAKKHHMLHHFRDWDVGFGVSTNLWDWVFDTDFAANLLKAVR